jgi:small subunit ribosomal protein S20
VSLVANIKSSQKRIRSSARKHEHNRIYRSRTRTEVKKARALIVQGNLDEAIAQTHEAIRILDKAVTKGVLPKNNAARRKSRLMRQLNHLQNTQAQQ